MSADGADLVSRAAAGDTGAFEALYRENAGRVYAVCLRMTGNPTTAEELAQEAFLKTYRARADFREGEAFLPWFHRILRNTCYTFLRRRSGPRQRSLETLLDPAGAPGESRAREIPDDRDDPVAIYEERERVRLLQEAFHELSERDREIIALRHFEELSYRAIADRLQIPIGTVMSRLFHARKRLRALLVDVLEPGVPASH